MDAGREPATQLREVLLALESPARSVGSRLADQVTAVVRAVRARPSAAMPLFVVDRLPPRPSAPWCRMIGEVPVLVTSRHPPPRGSAAVPLVLGPLDPPSAVRLLAGSRPGRALPAEAWRGIGAWAGGIPGVLVALSTLLRSGAVTPQDLHAWSRESPPDEALRRAEDALRGSVPDAALRQVAAAAEAFPRGGRRGREN